MQADNTLAVPLPASQTAVDNGRLLVHPDWDASLTRLGFTKSRDFLTLTGGVVSGHPDRHVVRTTLSLHGCESTIYLKREHHVPWKDRWSNWTSGFGFSSVSIREARMLDRLNTAGLPVPEWLAAGEVDGRAFLLIRGLENIRDLRRYLHDTHSTSDRRRTFRDLGRLLARVHDRGIDWPDMYAKHVLVDSKQRLTLIDWQRAVERTRLSWSTRIQNLSALDASLADDLASPRERCLVLGRYLDGSPPCPWSLRDLVARIRARSARLVHRSSLREQRLPAWHESQPLIWLDGESVVATPMGRERFTLAELKRLAVNDDASPEQFLTRSWISESGERIVLTRRRTDRGMAGVWDAVLGRTWYASELRQAAAMLRNERLGGRPQLLAFGQRTVGKRRYDSFLLHLAEE